MVVLSTVAIVVPVLVVVPIVAGVGTLLVRRLLLVSITCILPSLSIPITAGITETFSLSLLVLFSLPVPIIDRNNGSAELSEVDRFFDKS